MGNGRYDPNATAGILPISYELGRLRHESRVDSERKKNKLTYKKCDVTFDEMNGMYKQIVVGVVTLLIAGWIAYTSTKGYTLDAMVAGINTRVTVLETVASTIKDDILEIKVMMKEVRDDQRRRNR